MSTTHIQLEPRASERRCALCHGGLGLEPTTCPDCGTASHADCLDEARRCPTLGCARPTITRSEREVVVLRGCPRLLSCSYAPLLPVALALVWLGAWFADLSAGLF